MTLIDTNRLSAAVGAARLAEALDTAQLFDIDTIGFGRLVDNARAQIPRYAPAWTDHNLHDPGITIIELLAWIVDQQIYRVGFVNDRYLAAFATLLGQRLSRAMPALGLVWPDRPIPQPLALAEGESVLPVTASSATSPTVPFTLSSDILLSDAQTIAVALVDGFGPDAMEAPLTLKRGGPSIALEIGGSGALPGTGQGALVLRFDRPLAPIEGELSLGFDLVTPPGLTPDTENATTWGPLVFEYRVGNDDWGPATLADDGTAVLSRTGVIRIALPATPDRTEPSELRLRFDRGFFPTTPIVRDVAINVLPVIQRRVDPAETLGRGNGLPDQRVVFDSTGIEDPVIPVTVDDEAWEPVDNFCASGPTDRHFVAESKSIRFGNGLNGLTPPAGSAIVVGPVTRTDGAEGNVRADLAWRVPVITGVVDGFDIYGRNCEPFTGGTAASTVDDVLAAARTVATERINLLTDDELAAAALGLPGFSVARADVVPGYDPALPNRFVDGARSLVVFPRRAADNARAPVPALYLDAVADALADRRVLGERLLVLAPEIVVVDVELSLVAAPGQRPDEVAADVRSALARRLAVTLRRPDDEPWPLGRPLSVEDVKTIAAEVDGVLYVESCAIGREGHAPNAEPITPSRHGVVLLGQASVDAEAAGPARGGKQR
jgi:hypothetical protein